MAGFLGFLTWMFYSALSLIGLAEPSPVIPQIDNKSDVRIEQQIVSNAQDVTRLYNLDIIANALKAYYRDHSQYPTSLTALLNGEGSIEYADGQSVDGVILGDKKTRDEFFSNIAYIPYSDAQRYVLYLKLETTKSDHNYVPGGPYGPVNQNIVGVKCTDPYIYCVVDGNTKTVAAPATNVATSVDTSHWKTYRSESSGFEFKYPSDFVLEKDITSGYDDGGVYIYNYRYEFYPEYDGTKELTRFPNFAISVGSGNANSSGPPTAERVTIGANTFERVQRDKARHEMNFSLSFAGGKKYLAIYYRPIIDTSDIGALIYQPDFVKGVEVVKNNPEFLTAEKQAKILNSILSTVKIL